MSRLDTIDKYAARLLMVSFFFSSRFGMFVTIGACVWFVFRTVFLKQWQPRSNYLWALLLGSSFLLYLLAVPFTAHDYRRELWHICERRESFLLMPFVFAIITPAFRALIMDALIYFVYACIISCAISNADFFYHYQMGHDGTHPLSHVLYRIYFEAVSGLHPTYMGMYLVFSICILLQSSLFDVQGGKIIRLVLVFAALVFLMSLLAKSALIALVVIMLHSAYAHRHTLHRYKAMIFGSLAAVVITAVSVPFFRQRVGELFQVFGNGDAANSANNSVYVRKLIWNIDTDIIRQHWLWGVGPGRVIRMLHERYFFYSLSIHFPVGYYDPHNQYFYEWLALGICGLALLGAILVVHFVKALRHKDHLYLYLMIVLGITFFTETVLSRQQGVLFYGVFTSLFFFYWQGRKDNGSMAE